ncbi:hypothetical protein TWF506_003754 [Arthrobotrys conoides]|uniref:F-box domain-containing protein n=1 Tax=Arthrobotrys conoides TaxID=74498 RepID=A0AAN8N2S4_9PEZI
MSFSKPCLSITSLPPEIQLEILSYLTDMNSQASIYGTCAPWRRMLSENTTFCAARYYRGRSPYTFFPVVHRFFDISNLGNGRCQVRKGVIINYQYKTDAFGYMDASDMIANDTMFSPIFGNGWLASDRQGTRATFDSQSIFYHVVEDEHDVAIKHDTTTEEQDAEGEPASDITNLTIKADENIVMDAIWVNVKIGNSCQRDNNNPLSDTLGRIKLPRGSKIQDWANAFLKIIKLLLHPDGKSGAVDFDMDFRERFVSGSKPMEGWYIEIWVLLPESLTDHFARLKVDAKRNHSIAPPELLAFI